MADKQESVKAGSVKDKLGKLGAGIRAAWGIVPEEDKKEQEEEKPLPPPKKKKSAQEKLSDVVKSFKSWED